MEKESEKVWFYEDGAHWMGPTTASDLLRKVLDFELPENARVWNSSESGGPLPIHDTAFFSPVGDLKRFQVDDGTVRPSWFGRSPVVRILFLSALWLSVFLTAWLCASSRGIPLAVSHAEVFFSICFAFYLGSWSAYFLSANSARWLSFFRIPSLRSILRYASTPWHSEGLNHGGSAERESLSRTVSNSERVARQKLESAYRDKARVSMTSLAIMTAAALLILLQGHNLFLDTDNLGRWQKAAAAAAALAAFTSFACFLVAVDALDTVFNRSDDQTVDTQIARYFYQSAINPKYFGFAALITSLVFLVAFHSPVLAGFCVSIVLAIAYPYWFPAADIVRRSRDQPVRYKRRIFSSDFSPGRLGFFLRLAVFGGAVPGALLLTLRISPSLGTM